MPHTIMLSVGAILLASLAIDWVGRTTGLPRVTLLLLMGLLVGQNGFDIFPEVILKAADFITPFALTMVAFLLGSELSADKIKAHGREILIVSLTVVSVTALVVGAGLFAFGIPLAFSLILAAIATSTAPAATRDVIEEIDAKGPFKELILGVVAVDDAWGLIIFGLAMALVSSLLGADGMTAWALLLRHLGGAILIGVVIGLAASYVTGRLVEGRPSQIEAIAVVSLCGGLSIWSGASYLLAATIAGALVANLAKHHDYAFRELEHFEWPFLTVFFVLAGATLDLSLLISGGFLGVGYIIFRALGRIVGGWLGGRLARLPTAQRRWTGSALMPQAGVAVGMGLIVAQEFPEFGEVVLAITIGGTVVFELFGPVLTRLAFRKVESHE